MKNPNTIKNIIMHDHTKRLLIHIQECCQQYIEKKVNISGLEQNIGAVHSNFENDVPAQLRNDLYNFTVDLETIELMEEEKDHYHMVVGKIAEINLVINKFMK